MRIHFNVLPLAIALAANVAAADPSGSLTIDQARDLALARSPAIRAAERALDARRGTTVQSSLAPNPEASLSVEDVAGSGAFEGARRAETTLRIDQRLELGGKRSARFAASDGSRQVAASALAERRAEVAARVAETFYDTLAAQERLLVRGEATSVAEEVLAAVRGRVRAGRLSEVEEKRAGVAAERARLAEERAGLDLRAARRNLASTWGSIGEPAFPSVVGNLFAPRPLPSLEEIPARLANAPEIRRASAEVELRTLELQLAERKAAPDVVVGGGVRRYEETGDQALVVGVSVPLPIFDRNQGSVAEARALRLEAQENKTATETRLLAELSEAQADLAATAREMTRIENVIVVEAREALDLARTGFDEGRFSLLEVLDAQRTFLEIREQYVETAARHWRLAAKIERITGEPL